MSELKQAFERAVAESKTLSARPDNMTLLRLYALFKQGTDGDATGERPGFSDFVGRAKWDAWHALAGTAAEDAMRQYIDLVEDLKSA